MTDGDIVQVGMAHAVTSKGNLALLGGELCLDFINTVDWRTGANPEEYLNSYPDLIEWSASIGTLSKAAARRLLRKAGAEQPAAAAALTRATEFRESLYAIMIAVSAGKGAPGKPLQQFNRTMAALAAKARVEQAGDSFEWVWSGAEDDLDRPLWAVAASAFDLLTSGAARQVRQCGDPACGWLFADKSKSHRRQWCSMKICGNRAKARRYYQKTRVRAEPS